MPPPNFRGNGMGTPSTRLLVRFVLRWIVGRRALGLLDVWAARWHDWFYLTGGRPTLDEIQAWQQVWMEHEGQPSNHRQQLCFAGGTDADRDRGDGLLYVNTRTVLRWAWPWWRRMLFIRVASWAVMRAVRDFGHAAFNKLD